jgi:hypothetical protein
MLIIKHQNPFSQMAQGPFSLRPVWITGIEFHSNNNNLGIYQLS